MEPDGRRLSPECAENVRMYSMCSFHLLTLILYLIKVFSESDSHLYEKSVKEASERSKALVIEREQAKLKWQEIVDLATTKGVLQM